MKKGAKGLRVKKVQCMLKKVLEIKIMIDGHFGEKTKKAVQLFQEKYGLFPDGIVGVVTKEKLEELYYQKLGSVAKLLHFGKPRFVVFVDAGHGGVDEDGNYVTVGKRAYHEDIELHDNGNYYEGYENRLIAEEFIEQCSNVGIMCIRLYHPYKDISLAERTEIVRSWLKRGYYGYLYSIHSNAISEKNTIEKINNTCGFMVFSTIGNNFSDEITTQHFRNVKNIVGADNWVYRTQTRKDKDEDFEVDFQVLRETDLEIFDFFGAILEEWGFHTSKKDAEFITRTDIRYKRVAAALATAKWVKSKLEKRVIYYNKI